MKLIAAVDKNWGLGRGNDLLFKLPLDMKRFKELTTGNAVVMGRKTLESLPGGKPLKNRLNIVLGSVKNNEVIAVANLEQLFVVLANIVGEVYVMGGGSVYNTLLPYCTHALITKVDADGGADVFLTNLDKNADFSVVETSEIIRDGDYNTQYVTYKNNNVKQF